MNKSTLIILIVAASFLSGFTLKSMMTPKKEIASSTSGRVTGIGGVFFKCKDPKALREWYSTHLGINTNAYGAVFEWYQGADSTQKGFTQWSPFKETTTYFAPSAREYMFNYRVSNMEALVKELSANGVTIVDTIESVEYGKFVHILDNEGTKVELWEPNDIEYEKMGKQMEAKTTK